jgi:hypothetical protein
MRQRLGVFLSETANIQNVIGKKWGGRDSARLASPGTTIWPNAQQMALSGDLPK